MAAFCHKLGPDLTAGEGLQSRMPVALINALPGTIMELPAGRLTVLNNC